MEDNSNNQTGFLNTPQAEPMQDRQPRPQTNQLGPGWKLQVKISGTTLSLDIEQDIHVGRATEDEETPIVLDLGPYGGYQGGVSRHHAVISRIEGSLYIEDLNSTNGTRINGFQLTPKRKYRLRDGDEVEFARLRMVFRFVRVARQ